jgi:hypothetical protein
MKLKKYLIYKHPELLKIEIIKDGFSLPAAIFGGAWLIYHKVWTMLLLFLFLIPIKMLSGAVLAQIISSLFLGFFAADILEWHYKKHGYVLYDIISAYSEGEVEIKIYEKLGSQNV